MKYVVDIPYNTRWIECYSPINGESDHFKGTVVGIDKMKTYIELDRKAIEEEVWDFTWKMFDLGIYECMNIFGKKGRPSDYQEAKAKYEAWKGQKNEEGKLRVGDEIRCADGDIGVVTFVYNDTCDCIWGDGSVAEVVCKTEFEKTGRHFDEVVELMKKMKEGGK